MKLKRIALQRVPGIDPGFVLDDLVTGLNVIVGPNGCGKTSLCRAVSATLWPRRFGADGVEVETIWEEDGRRLRAELRGKRVSWQQQGNDSEPPPLPDEHLALCYFLDIRDLLAGNRDTDADLATRIRVQMSGGYDLQALLDGRFLIPPRAGRRERQRLEEEERRFASERKILRELSREEDRLQTLRAEQAQARDAYREVQALDRAIELAGARAELAAVNAKLALLPEPLDRFTGGEIERLGELEKDRAEAVQAVEECRSRVREADAAIQSAGLREGLMEDAVVDAAVTRARKLQEQEREMRTAATRAAEAETKLGDARSSLNPGSTDFEQVPCIDLSALNDLERLVQDQSDLRAGRAAVQERLSAMSRDGDGGDDADALARGVDALHDWLAAPGPRDRIRVPAWIVISSLVAAGTGSVLSLGSSPWWSLVTGTGLGVVLIAVLFRLFGRDEGAREREVHLQRWWALKLPDPPSWSVEEVRAYAHSMEERLARARISDAQKFERDALEKRDQALEIRARQLDRQREDLGRRLGLQLPAADLTVIEWAQRIRVYREAAGQQASAASAYDQAKRDYGELLAAVDAFFRAQGYPAVKDAAAAVAVAEDFRSRRETYRRGIELRERAEAQGRVNETKLEQLGQRTARLYCDRGLADGDREGLERCAQEWPHYKELCAEKASLTGRIADLEHKLSDRGDYLALSIEQARRKKERAESSAQAYEDATREIGDIQGRVSEACRAHRLEDAAAAREAAREKLVDVRETVLLAAAGKLLIEDIEHEHERKSRPEVLRRAMYWFQAFTRDRYELMLSDDAQSGFRALDTSNAKGLSLSQLSDATRIQLLLAVRLAFAYQPEREAQPPLFFDETLSTADPERFRAVAQSLMVLVGEGRQVIYLTSNPSDAAVFGTVPDAGAVGPPRVIDLAAVRSRQSAVLDAAELEPPPALVLPSPEGKSSEQYGVELGVRLPDPYGPVEALHLFYLLRDDLSLLQRVLSATRVETVGRWASLVSRGGAEALLSPTIVRRIDTLVDCVRAIFEGWSIGRGKPVTREVLAASSALTSVFVDRLGDLAEDFAGDGDRLIVAIHDGFDPRVKRLRGGSIEKLIAYLEDNGFVDPRPPLAQTELETYVLQAMAETIAAGRLTSAEVCRQVRDLIAVFERSTAASRVAA